MQGACLRLIACLCLSFGFVAGVSAKVPLPPGVSYAGSVEGVSEYRLSNGLQVLLYADQSKPTVTVNVTYMVGSRHENYGETGMAHLLEHLIFKGSKNYPNPDKEFSRRGFRNNGSTWFDRTNYFSTFRASDDNLRWALGWKADAMTQSFISKKDLDSEMTVVRNEYEMGENNPTNVTLQRMLSMSFDWHNYGNPTIGNRSDIENVRIENLQAFYRRYYQPDNAVLIVAGKFDEARTLQWIAQSFGRIPRPTRKLPPLWTVEPTQDGERSFAVRRQGDVQLVLQSYKVPSALHPDTDAISAAAEILSNTPNGRLHAELVQQSLAAQVFSFVPPTRDNGLAIFGAVVKKGESVERARDRLIDVVEESFKTQAPTEAELQRLRSENETAFERVLSDPEQFGVSLSEYVALGDWRLFFLARDRLTSVQPGDIAQAASRYFLRDNRTVGLFQPEDKPQRATLPSAPTVAQRMQGFKPREAMAQGEAFDPSQDNIDMRTRRVVVGDLKLALLPKKTRGETVNVALSFDWGNVDNLRGKSVVSQLTEFMVARGTTRYTRQQLADELTRLKITGSLREFQTTRENLPSALQLVAHVMREPSFPESEFELLKREITTAWQAQLNDPSERSRDALRATFNIYPPGDPRYYMPLQERLAAVQATTLEDVKRFHAEYWGTSRGEIAVVGDFDDKAIEAAIPTGFAGWQSKVDYARVLSEYRDVAAQRLVINTPDRENAVLRARMNVQLRDDDPDFPALTLANTIIGGGGGLSNRLIDRLRQREGISYSTGSALLVNAHDRAAAFQLIVLAAPQNMQRAEQAVREELERVLREGFTEQELQDAKKGLLQERVVARAQDGVLAVGWVNNLDAGRSFQFSKALEQRIQQLSTAEVLAALRRHIDVSKMSFVLAGDTSKGFK